MTSIINLQTAANVLRRDVLEMTFAAQSGHLTSCLSCAEIISVLFFHSMKYDVKNSDNENNDEFILSKGHAAPILYAALKRAECIKTDLNTLRQFESPLEGHPMPSPYIRVATGSLGQGLSIGVGMALAGKLSERTYTTYILIGDSELAEGSNYEAMQLASYYGLDNLVAIVDVNKLGQQSETMLGHDLNSYTKRFESFGWEVFSIEGHEIKEIIDAIEKAKKSNKPAVILAKTIKGKGIRFIENKNGWHGRAVSKEHYQQAIKEIPEEKFPHFTIKKPEKNVLDKVKSKKFLPTTYTRGQEIATREAYGNALLNLSQADRNIIALDAEVSNSTFSEKVKQNNQKQFIESFIAEQNLIGMALGLSKKNYNVFASTFGAFLTRAYDQLRMAAYSNGKFTVCGSHAGVSIGEDGVSQMALEDISLFRSLYNSTIFYPSDAVSCNKIVEQCKNLSGIKYIRTTRGKTPVIYSSHEKFPVGDFKVLKKSAADKLVLVGAGITVHESLKAFEDLKNKKINAAVIDVYCIKPFNHKKLFDFVENHGNKLVIVEDHYESGGIGEMILSKISCKNKHLCVRKLPHSGKPDELLSYEQINAATIIAAARELLR